LLYTLNDQEKVQN